MPDYGTGRCHYDFTVFHLDEAGQTVTDDTDQVEFVAEPSTTWSIPVITSVCRSVDTL